MQERICSALLIDAGEAVKIWLTKDGKWSFRKSDAEVFSSDSASLGVIVKALNIAGVDCMTVEG